MERGARLSGSRFGYLAGDTALVAMALYRLALDRAAELGHTPLLPPVLVREEAMYGTGFFPTEKSNIYALEADGLYLTGTSEVALAGFHMGEILEELPLRYSAFSTCFRRESGAAGKDTRGMFRVHQFNKVELFVFCEPGRSGEEHDRLLAIEEELVQALGLPYRVVNVAAGDLGDPAAKKYDIEAWFPSQQRYREITSTSNTTDFQARRLGIRYRADEKRLETPAHAERHGSHRPLAARDSRELRRRRAGRARGIRRARASRPSCPQLRLQIGRPRFLLFLGPRPVVGSRGRSGRRTSPTVARSLRTRGPELDPSTSLWWAHRSSSGTEVRGFAFNARRVMRRRQRVAHRRRSCRRQHGRAVRARHRRCDRSAK